MAAENGFNKSTFLVYLFHSDWPPIPKQEGAFQKGITFWTIHINIDIGRLNGAAENGFNKSTFWTIHINIGTDRLYVAAENGFNKSSAATSPVTV